MAIQIFTDSTSYLSAKIIQQFKIHILSLSLSFHNEPSIREVDIDNEEFYQLMAVKGIPTSSQPSVGDMYQEMKRVVEQGDDLCCVFLSSDMSGTYSTGETVKKKILKEYPQAQIEVIDSRSNSMQLGYAVIQAARAAQAGATLQQVKQAVLDNIKRSRFLFIPDNLVYLKKGGRIGGAGALIGNLLKIIPILTVENGVTSVLTKVRTKKNAVLAMVDKMMHDINDHGLGEIVVHHINCLSEAKQLAATIKEKLQVNIDIVDIGPIIGLHVGPGAIGIVYYTQEELRP